MIFKWKSGEEKHLLFGSQICGLRRKGARPDEVVFTLEDMLEAVTAEGVDAEKAWNYLHRMVRPALSKDLGVSDD